MSSYPESLPGPLFPGSHQRELSGALDHLNIGVYLTDPDRRIILWNRKAEEITGYSAAEVVGKACHENILVHVDHNGRRLCTTDLCPLHRSIALNKEGHDVELVFARTKEGKRVAVTVSTAPVCDASGRVVGGIETFRDETAKVCDLEFARRIQQNILPDETVGTDEFGLDVHYHPHDLIGGDFYDVIPLPGNRFGILAADVRGHGVSAALYTMLLKSLKEKLIHRAGDPAGFIAGLNSELAGYVVDDSYATGVYAVLDASSWSLRYCCAGHPPLIHYRAAGGTTELLQSEGLPLGILEGERYASSETVLEPGDLVLFYTDGLTETRTAGGPMIGEDGLAELLRQEVIDPAMDLPKRLYDRVLALSGEQSLDDDALILTLTRR